MTHTLLFDLNTGATQDDAHAQLSPQWAEQLEQVMQQDRNFFLQHPETDYYVRPITPAEVMEGQSMGKVVDATARVLVGEVAPGSRVRLTILDDLPPLDEFRALQQQLRQELGAKPATLRDRIKHNQKSRPRAQGFGVR
jgi:hypothetical protein